MVRSLAFRLLPLLFITTLMGACQSNSGSSSIDEPDDQVLAKIGDETITLKRFQEFYENLPPEILLRYQGESGKKAILDQLVELNMYAQRARQLGLDKDPENQRRIEEAVEKILATSYHLKEVIEKVTVTDEEIRNYYQLHKEEHIRPEQVRVREIIVTNQNEAEEVLKLINQGTSFESLARSRTADSDRRKSGGDLGWQQRGQGIMAPAVEEAAFSLKKGEIGGPIKTDYGYHIIKVEGRLETHQRTLEETYQPIKNKIRNIKQRELISQLKAQAEQELKVKVSWDLLNKIPLRQALLPGMGSGPGETQGTQTEPPTVKP